MKCNGQRPAATTESPCDAAGSVLTKTDPRSKSWSYIYDDTWRLRAAIENLFSLV